MTESISSSNSVSLSALSDLKSFFSSGADVSLDVNDTEEENKTVGFRKRSDVTRKALTKLLKKKYRNNSETLRKNAEEESRNNADKANPLQIDASALPSQSPLEIKRPEVRTDDNALPIDVSALSDNPPLKINVSETETKTASYSIPKQKSAILNELRNTKYLRYTAWDIAKKYGIPYLQAQEIFVDLNRDESGVVKEFNLPSNSTVSYLV